jgi:hypothetical protein
LNENLEKGKIRKRIRHRTGKIINTLGGAIPFWTVKKSNGIVSSFETWLFHSAVTGTKSVMPAI